VSHKFCCKGDYEGLESQKYKTLKNLFEDSYSIIQYITSLDFSLQDHRKPSP